SAYRIGGYGTYVWGMGFAVAAMTAFYMFRLYHMTFSGTFRGTEEQAHHVHESPRTMVLPLQVLAVGSILARLLGVPAIFGEPVGFPHFFERFTDPVFEPAHEALRQVFTQPVPGHGMEWTLMAASVIVALLGILVATFCFQWHPEYPERVA